MGCAEDEAEAYVRPLLGSMNGPWRWRSLDQYSVLRSRVWRSTRVAWLLTTRSARVWLGLDPLVSPVLKQEAKEMVGQCMPGALGMSTGCCLRVLPSDSRNWPNWQA